MAEYTQSFRKSFKAAGDLSSSAYTAVKLDSNGNVVAATAATDEVIGFLENAPKLNDSADVYLRNAGGTCRAVAGGTITPGQKLEINSSGQVVYIGGTPTAGHEIVGVAVEAGAANQVIQIAPHCDRV